jgi:hypothetical protein
LVQKLVVSFVDNEPPLVFLNYFKSATASKVYLISYMIDRECP